METSAPINLSHALRSHVPFRNGSMTNGSNSDKFSTRRIHRQRMTCEGLSVFASCLRAVRPLRRSPLCPCPLSRSQSSSGTIAQSFPAGGRDGDQRGCTSQNNSHNIRDRTGVFRHHMKKVCGEKRTADLEACHHRAYVGCAQCSDGDGAETPKAGASEAGEHTQLAPCH